MRSSVVAVGLMIGCGDDGGSEQPGADAAPTGCSENVFDHGRDGLYEGYSTCSAAFFPDFRKTTGRWDGNYAAGCTGASGEHLFACNEQMFWQALQFEDEAGRLAAYEAMKAVAARAETDPGVTTVQNVRIQWRTAQLGVSILAENGNLAPGLQVKGYLEKAHELEPDNVIIEAWLRTVEVNTAVALGQDPEPLFEALLETYEKDRPAVAGTVMGVAAAMPLETGFPDLAVQLVDGVDMNDCTNWCGWEFLRAPSTFAGQYFSYAEVYARVGMKDEAVALLEKTTEQPGYDVWPYRDVVEAYLADPDAYLKTFADRGASEAVSDLLVSATTAGCLGCHAAKK